MTKRPTVDTVPKEYRPVVRAALDAGWTASRTRQGHMKLTAPDGSYATPIPTSGRGHTGLHKALVARLRNRGVTVT